MARNQRDYKTLNKMARYLRRPRTVEELQERFDLQRRTTYRWLEYLQEEGHDVVQRKMEGTTRFAVL